MSFSKNCAFFVFLLFTFLALVLSACGPQKIIVKDLLNQPIEEAGNFNRSKKYIKAGITVVYLTGSPHEIGFAHGKLCKDEIIGLNQLSRYINI